MKLKTKLIASIMSICLVCAVFAIGVFALKNANLKIGGDVSFTATGVEATISNAALTGMTTPNGFATGGEIDTSMTQGEIDAQFTTWQNLTMQFDENGTDIGFSFNIKNDSTNANNYIEIDYGYSFGAADVNVDVFPATTNNYIIKPGETNSFGLIVRVVEKELDVAQTSLSINFELKHITPSVGTLADGKITLADGAIYRVNTTDKTASLGANKVIDPEYGIGFYFVPDNNGYEGTELNIAPIISDGTDKYIVTSVDEGAFYYCSSLTAVTIPNSVTNIGGSAFDETNLTTIIIPKGVTSIGEYVFQGTNLTGVSIPSSVTSIGYSAFSSTKLTSVIIPSSVTSIGNSAFSATKLTSVIIPSSVTRIASYLFSSCPNLATISIPNSVTSIGEGAFQYCESLTTITIPRSVTKIGMNPFGSSGLEIASFENPTGWFKASSADATEGTPVIVTSGFTQENANVLNGIYWEEYLLRKDA